MVLVLHMFQLPKSLWPRRDASQNFIIPNVAVGRIQVEDETFPVFSAFFSHAMFLDATRWTLVVVPGAGDDAPESKDGDDSDSPCRVFMDPMTLHVFGKSPMSVFMDQDTIAMITLHLPEGADADAHWTGVGMRYKMTYDMLRAVKKPVQEPKASSDEAPKASEADAPILDAMTKMRIDDVVSHMVEDDGDLL